MNPYPSNQYAPPQPPPPGYGHGVQPGVTPEDVQNLHVLSICHFVYAGVFGLVSLLAAVVMLGAMLAATGGIATSGKGEPGAALVLGFVDVLLGFVVLAFLTKTALLAYSGLCMRKRRHRTFTMVMACLACLNVPLGTMLGVFTLVVLSKPSVKALYEPGR
jgi:hypothetical protein